MAKKSAVVEDTDDELDDLDEDVEEEVAPKKSKSKSKADSEVEFGASDLAKHLTELTGKNISAKDLRVLIRKMAREDKPRVDREVVAGNRARYNWPGGLKNAEVKAIIAAVTKGELEAGKKEALDALKAKKAAKDAKEGKTKKGKSKSKAKVVEEIEEVEDDDDDLEDDDE